LLADHEIIFRASFSLNVANILHFQKHSSVSHCLVSGFPVPTVKCLIFIGLITILVYLWSCWESEEFLSSSSY